MFTMPSPFCGYNMVSFVECRGKDLLCYSNKIDSVGLRKWPYDHWLIKKVYLSDIIVTNISPSFTHKMVTKTSCHRYGTKLRHCHAMYCLSTITYSILTEAISATKHRRCVEAFLSQCLLSWLLQVNSHSVLCTVYRLQRGHYKSISDVISSPTQCQNFHWLSGRQACKLWWPWISLPSYTYRWTVVLPTVP